MLRRRAVASPGVLARRRSSTACSLVQDSLPFVVPQPRHAGVEAAIQHPRPLLLHLPPPHVRHEAVHEGDDPGDEEDPDDGGAQFAARSTCIRAGRCGWWWQRDRADGYQRGWGKVFASRRSQIMGNGYDGAVGGGCEVWPDLQRGWWCRRGAMMVIS